MATSSINTVSAGGNKKYMAGLASGMDTESIVQNLLAGTQSKIDKQTGLKQQLEWKQDLYREIITKVNTLKDKYFSYYGSGNSNLMSSALFNTMTGVSSSDAVRISSVSSSALGGMTIDSIEQLATACQVKSKSVTGAAAGTAASFADFTEGETYSFSVTLDGVNKTVEFTAGADGDATLDNINQALYRNFGTSVAMEMNGSSIKLVKLKLDDTGNVTGTEAFDTSRRVIIGASGPEESATIKYLGFEGGFSNKLDYGTSLKNMNFAIPLQGERYEFEINGAKITGLTGDSTLSDVLAAINNSKAGVRVSYSSITDGFVMESKSTGEISKIEMSQTHGNLLSMMFGVKETGMESSLFQQDIVSQDPSDMRTLLDELNAGKDKTFELLVDGEKVTVKLAGKTGSSKYEDVDSIITELNSQLDKQLGTGAVKFSRKPDATDATKKYMVITSATHQVELDGTQADGEVAKSFGFTGGVVNTLGPATKLVDMGVKGSIEVNNTTITLKSTDTVADFVTALNNAGCDAKYENGRFEIMPKEIPGTPGTLGSLTITALDSNGTAAINKLFGCDSIKRPDQLATALTTAGKNAKLTVNGTDIERNTNLFEMDGITVELMAKYDKANTPITLTTSRDTDKIVNSIKGFAEDYNKLIEELNEYITESASYKKYPPLTEAQKKEMSDKEVELWEEKSKTGLLRNDSNINSFLSDMRTVLYSRVEEAGLSLYDLGVETSDNWRDNGKLVIDEEKLKSAASTNADAISKLFTDRENGLGAKLLDVMNASANVSSGSPGSMVRYAGTKDVLVTSNTLYDEMKRISDTLSNLNVKYQLEKTRYWNQFNAMEQAISNMNSQSAWLTQQFSLG